MYVLLLAFGFRGGHCVTKLISIPKHIIHSYVPIDTKGESPRIAFAYPVSRCV